MSETVIPASGASLAVGSTPDERQASAHRSDRPESVTEPRRPVVLNFDAWRISGVPDTSYLNQDSTFRYRIKTVLADLIIVSVSTVVAWTARFGLTNARLATPTQGFAVPYAVVVLATAGLWILALALSGCWSPRLPLEGPTEFRRLATCSVFVFSLTVTLDYLLRLDIARGYLLLALPLATLCMMAVRLLLRHGLRRQWANGKGVTNVLVVGGRVSAMLLAQQFRRSRHGGYRVAGLCVPGGAGTEREPLGAQPENHPRLAGIPVVGGLHEVVAAIERCSIAVVAVAPTDGYGPREVRNLSWSLEGTGVRLVLAPAVDDLAQPRVRLRTIAGLPLMHVEEARLRGAQHALKVLSDVLIGSLVLLLASPLLLACALAIKVDDGGPVFFRQERIGRRGKPFAMWKFRSMVPDAEARIADLRDHSEGNGVLFKMHNDPRVTRVGKFLRRTSLDELPQLFNVLTGTMSLVGPRPPLLHEVAQYDSEVYRKLWVKPGMTGLWQVSGRSDIEWDESVRLDLYYVENWSLVGDLVILLQTVRALVARQGAY